MTNRYLTALMPQNETSNPETWVNAISQYDAEYKSWIDRSKKIVDIYRDHDDNTRSTDAKAKFNILWSNVQTSIPAVFSRIPKPDVSRRFRDNDPIGRVASLILERALEYEIDKYDDYCSAMRNCVQDRFLGGRGTAWVRYEPHFKPFNSPETDDGYQVTEDVEDESYHQELEVIDYECSPVDYVHWKDFGHTLARTWEEVTAVWRKVYMGREALVERFGEELGNQIPLDQKPEDLKKTAGGVDQSLYQAVIYEIWDKPSGKAIWLSKSMGKVLDERDDPLGLDGFFPCPRPLYSTITTDSLKPVPDYKLYQDQAEELNILADRIDGLIKALKVRGVYDAAESALGRLFTEGENNTLIPVKNWASFVEKQGLKGAIDIVDITPFALALKECYVAQRALKEEIYEITGLADIIRGSTDPNETATAQKMKGSFGSMRLRDMQSEVVRFATSLLKIKAQIICNHYQPETILMISSANQLLPVDQQMIPQAIQMLKNETLTGFRIEVSSDSMVQIDEMQEKQDRAEFLKATSSFLKDVIPAAQSNPQLAPMMGEMLKFGVSAFKVGKGLEGIIDETIDKLREAAENPQPKQDPEMMKIQAQMQQKQQEMQLEFMMDKQRLQMEAQLETHRQEVQAQEVAHQNQLEAQRMQMQAGIDAQLEQSRQQFELLIARIDAMKAISVAEIGAQATLDAKQIDMAGQAFKEMREDANLSD